ncbi:glycosyltransferase family 9 protein [Endomicrobium proavitum]|uniref:Putative Glycosyl transferase, family 9 n=1 Tax=Endomicrobium proavitum TaxID=1408281 RepID=A0A0G3WI72_9BACT|nr:glycosyltransferase family 9 protein [Endomicrobium proavitum]AKL98386.1 putative Glycosyl transferase, family 9 [Endomicrobium proavitum]
MKFKTEIFLDRFIGHIACFFLGVSAWCLGKILKRDHSVKQENVRVIAVAKYFGMGSITHAVPMLRALKSRYPKAKLIFITRKNNKQIIDLISYIDKAFYIKDKSLIALAASSVLLIFKLQREKVDLFFDLEVFSAYGVLISLLSLARNRLGFFFAHSTNFKTWLHTHLMYFNFQMPLRLSYMQLARLGGASPQASIDLEPFNLNSAVLKSCKKRLNKIIKNKGKKIIGINVNASELSFARRWSLENFAKVASYFADNGYGVLLFGSAQEKYYAQQLFDFLSKPSENIYNIAGKFPLPEVLALLPICDAFLTNDSGLMNLAYAQNAKVVALYGANSPQFVHIDNGVNEAVYKKSFCSPCLYIFDDSPCATDVVCMKNITVNNVISAVSKVLQTPAAKIKPTSRECIVVNKELNYVMGTLKIK